MNDRQLILTCTVCERYDGTSVVAKLLQQYGLHTSTLGSEVVAQGDLPEVLATMRSFDIEAHLLGRIEDAAPGTKVAEIRATILPRASN